MIKLIVKYSYVDCYGQPVDRGFGVEIITFNKIEDISTEAIQNVIGNRAIRDIQQIK